MWKYRSQRCVNQGAEQSAGWVIHTDTKLPKETAKLGVEKVLSQMFNLN